MKKKILFTLCVVFVISIASCTVALAERFAECPVTLTTNYNSSTTINEFEIYNVENLYGKYQNRIYYNFDDTGYISLDLICYNDQGTPLQTLSFNKFSEYIDVPDTTAMIELVPNAAGANTNTFFYCKYINAYSTDGRVMGVPYLMEPVYKMVGWYPEIAVYADDGRTMNISPFQVEEYSKVGWYTAEVSQYRTLARLYNEYKARGDYQSIIELVDDNVHLYEGTPYASSLYEMKTDAMDSWRVACNAPVAYTDYYISENSIDVPEANIKFTNVSYKTIAGFKLKFTCYNLFGSVEKTYYDYYYIDDANLAPGESDEYYWTLYGADSVNSLSNIRITEVVFSDGTKWYR